MKILASLLPEKPCNYKGLVRDLGVQNGYQMMYYLRTNQFIEEHTIDNKKYIQITEKGIKKVLDAEIIDLKIPTVQKWDGLWRIVFFDIPEAHKLARDALSRKLKDIGFRQIQKSIYVYPYECQNEIEKIRCFYHVRNYVFLLRAPEIEGADNLKKVFKIT